MPQPPTLLPSFDRVTAPAFFRVGSGIAFQSETAGGSKNRFVQIQVKQRQSFRMDDGPATPSGACRLAFCSAKNFSSFCLHAFVIQH